LRGHCKDPELLAEGKKVNLNIQHVPGEQVDEIVQRLFEIEPAFIVRMNKVLAA
jgi:hypothetical protein